MGVFSIFGRGRAAAVPLPVQKNPPTAPISPYSAQYETIVAQGHEQPTPTFDAPTLVWHVGVWPRRAFDPHDMEVQPDPPRKSRLQRLKETFCFWPFCRRAPEPPVLSRHDLALREYHLRRYHWIADINARLETIESKGRTRIAVDADGNEKGRSKRFGPNPPPATQAAAARAPWWKRRLQPLIKTATQREARVESGAVAMTLWWPNSASGAPDDPDAIRIRLHCNLTPDFVTFSFHVDVATAWGGGRIVQASASGDSRRDRMLKAIAEIDRQCKPTAEGARGPLLPESGIDDAALLDARNVLFVETWEELSRHLGCTFEELAGPRGEVFANFRGLVLSTSGAPGVPPTFDRFSKDPHFDADGSEANAVVNAYWPLMRRITPCADYREYVVCGLMNWRALYLTALGSHSLYDEGEERKVSPAEKGEADIGVRKEVLRGLEAPSMRDDTLVRRRLDPHGRNHPVRYLVLTKGAPEPRQLGRIVERINTLGTLRLYALKDWDVIEAADTSIRILGQQLDQVTRDWSEKRDLVEALRNLGDFRRATRDQRFSAIHRDLRKIPTYGVVSRFRRWLFNFVLSWATVGLMRQHVRNNRKNVILDSKHALLSEVADGLEARLIRINSDLDHAGLGASGGLHFRINRSRYHVKEFHRLVKMLQIGNVQTWTSYAQFVTRGLAPSFDYIANVGKRIQALRLRLTSVTDTIEAGALVGQSSATRYNTAVLRQVLIIMSAVFAIYLLKAYMPKALIDILDKAGMWFQANSQWIIESTFGVLAAIWKAVVDFFNWAASVLPSLWRRA